MTQNFIDLAYMDDMIPPPYGCVKHSTYELRPKFMAAYHLATALHERKAVDEVKGLAVVFAKATAYMEKLERDYHCQQVWSEFQVWLEQADKAARQDILSAISDGLQGMRGRVKNGEVERDVTGALLELEMSYPRAAQAVPVVMVRRRREVCVQGAQPAVV